MKKKSIRKRQMRKDCWNLDYAFIKWLNDRLPIYLKDASTIVNLNYHKFIYKEQEYTQEELIRYLIKLCRGFVDDTYDTICHYEEYMEIFQIWAIIAPAMWW